MNTATTFKKATSKEDPVVISLREYTQFIEFKKIKEFKPTPSQKRALAQAEQNFKKGKALSYNELVQKLGFEN